MKSLLILCSSILLLGLAHLSSAQEVVSPLHKADQMPIFQGCEDISDIDERAKCAEQKMLEFVYRHLHYPPEARKNGIEGMVIVQFTIAIDGYVEDIKVVRDLKDGCGEAALSIIEDMNEMDGPPYSPALLDGKAVPLLYTLPIRFKL
jgi:TonB family protein